MLKSNDYESVLIDKDIIDFLRVAYFGTNTDIFQSASTRAYLDMCRTIRFNGFEENERLKLREEVTKTFKMKFKDLNSNSINTQDDFDNWHMNLCDEIIDIYNARNINLTYGQAQKWINMTIKYLYVLGVENFENVFQFLHIPVDNYIINKAKKLFNIKKPILPRSRWNDYDNQYLKYQKELRSKIKDYSPLRWEFKNWIIASRDKG